MRELVVSLHYEGMMTNEEICQAVLRSTLANHDPVANRHGPQQKPKTQTSGVRRRIEMRSKKEREEKISRLKKRQGKRGVTKKKRSWRVK